MQECDCICCWHKAHSFLPVSFSFPHTKTINLIGLPCLWLIQPQYLKHISLKINILRVNSPAYNYSSESNNKVNKFDLEARRLIGFTSYSYLF